MITFKLTLDHVTIDVITWSFRYCVRDSECLHDIWADNLIHQPQLIVASIHPSSILGTK